MKLSVYGAGYVGLVSAACFAELGHEVVCADVDEARVALLQQGICPIYEQHLPQLLKKHMHTRQLQFVVYPSPETNTANVHCVAVGTPTLPEQGSDVSYVQRVVEDIAKAVTQETLIVIKSTVPVGTALRLQKHVVALKPLAPVRLASNPEFLREGTAVKDFLHPDRVILGGCETACSILKKVYAPLAAQGIPLLSMDTQSAELTKYAANAMLATKISFINQISQIAEVVGANVDDVREGIAADVRIGPHFIAPGVGYGGSCFPKDLRALIHQSTQLGISAEILHAVEQVNHQQKQWIFNRFHAHFKEGLASKTLGIWGLSFKPDTDDIREAVSLTLIPELLKKGVTLRVYDPKAMAHAKAHFKGEQGIVWCEHAKAVLEQPVDALCILTEWAEFKHFPLAALASLLQGAPVFDGRNCFAVNAVSKAGIRVYYSVGRPCINQETLNMECDANAG